MAAPYNYTFANDITTGESDFISDIVDGLTFVTPAFETLQESTVALGLPASGTANLWGPSMDVLLYVQPTTLRVTAGGWTILTSKASIQQVVYDFYTQYNDLLNSFAGDLEWPMNGPVEIRVTGLDQPSEAGVSGAVTPLLSAVTPRPDQPGWDVAVWIDMLTVPGTSSSLKFYEQMEQWLFSHYTGSYASVRPEWSKGWAFSSSGAWTNTTMLTSTIPDAINAGQAQDSFHVASAAFDAFDPYRIFGNTFLDTLLPLRTLEILTCGHTYHVADLEAVLIEDVGVQLGRWRRECAGRPEAERSKLLLLALEREQIVAVAYREEAVAGRVAELEVGDQVRALIRQTLVWIWKDEQLHAEFTRGLLLEAGGLASSLVVYGRQVQGALSGWTSSTATNRMARSAPLRTGAAGVLVAAAETARRMPPELARQLRYQTFHQYCALNVALEASAEFAYRRLVEVARSAEERVAFDRIRADEERHAEAFRVLTEVITTGDRLADGVSAEDLAARLARISPWFIPAAQRRRPAANGEQRSFGTGAPVVVRGGRTDADKSAVLSECLDRAGLDRLAGRARSAAIRVSFMLGYDRADRSNVNDPELVDLLARYLRRHGVADVAVLEAPTVYGNLFSGRSVASVAGYFGFASPAYRIVDIGADMRPWVFDRGFVQKTISGTWLDADLRIVMPKLRTDPTEFAHLSLSTLEGSTGAIDESFYAGRTVDFRSATMMLLDVAPPHFAVVDAWAPVADGPFGVMGCHRPAQVRYLYAGADALAVDAAVLADLGIGDPRRAPIVAQACHWFGLDPRPAAVDGPQAPLRRQLRGAHSSALLRGLATVSYPVYMYASNRGELFVPAMDTAAFPPSARCGAPTRAVRWLSQRAFGLRAPATVR